MFHLVKSVLASQQENRIIRPRRALDLFSCMLGFIGWSFGDCMQGRRQPVGSYARAYTFFFRPTDFSQ